MSAVMKPKPKAKSLGEELSGSSPAIPAVVHQKWEYLMIASNYVSGERLNLLGQEGWELVTVAPNAWYYFKRKAL